LAEPVTLAEARAQVNIIDVADTTFDTFLTSLIPQARAYVERESRFFWVAATRTEVFTGWGEAQHRQIFSRHSRGQYLEIYRRESVIADTRAAAVEVPQTVSDLLDTLRPLSAY
jgi:hypothetical protein